MTSQKNNAFKTPQKSVRNIIHRSPSVNFQLRFRSPLANIQMSSVPHSSQFTTGSPMRILHHNIGTPPKPLFKIRNPFEKTLIDNLHTPMCSPGMFKIRECESSGTFKWDIEHMSVLKPADIVPCNSQFEPSPDPILEQKATDAIEKFFSQEMIVPSPLDEAPKRNILPMDSRDDHATTPEGTKFASREVWTQTALTLPANLPPEVENSLKSYYTYSKEQIGVAEADISANASLRRKLCFEEVFSDVEEEFHMSFHNISCPTFQSPHANPLLRGFKRNFDSPQSGGSASGNWSKSETPGSSKMISDEELIGFSPISKNFCNQNNIDEEIHIRSPSLSPIGKSPKESSNSQLSTNMSPKKHSCDISSFSQSTPEKSSPLSKTSTKSSPDIIIESDTSIHIQSKNVDCHKFSRELCQLIGEHRDGIMRRSKSDISLASLGRSRSAMKLDFNMDVSTDNSTHFSGDQSLRCHSVMGDSDSNTSKHSNNWDIENAEYIMAEKKSLEECEKWEANLIQVEAGYKSYVKQTRECKNTINDECDKTQDIYQFLTPTKNKPNDACTFSSPMQMSPDCRSDNNDKNPFTEQPSHSKINESHFRTGHTSSGKFTKSFFNNQQYNYSDTRNTTASFQRLDSGIHENLMFDNNSLLNSCDVTVCTSKHTDVTKSFNCVNEASSVCWKRFDSGFNEEASSDFSHQIGGNETSKQLFKKYPMDEFSEHKENIYFEEFHKILDRGPLLQDTMSISDIFAEDMVSFGCNFSSTPSKCLRKSSK